MKRRMRRLLTVFLVFLSFGCLARITINVHNKTGNQGAFIYLDTSPGSVVGLKGSDQNFQAQQYKQPFLDGNDEYQISFDSIENGKLQFGLLGPVSGKSEDFKDNLPLSPESDAYTGLLEFTYIPPANGEKGEVYWNLNNLEQVGMLCGLTSDDPGMKKTGYGRDGNAFLQGLIKELSARSADIESVVVRCGPKLKYKKILGPTVLPEAYSKMYAQYLNDLTVNRVSITLDTETLPVAGSGYKSWMRYDWLSSEFTGHFTAPVEKRLNGTLVKNVILELNNYQFDTSIFLTEAALNGKTIEFGDSDSGMYVTYNDELIDDTSVSPVLNSTNVHLNWVGNTAANTYRYQAWVESAVRELLIALNCGRIPTAAGGHYFQKDENSWVSLKNRKYQNPYNKYIAGNSNSYGMSYADGAGGKVQHLTSPDVTVDLYLLAPDDKEASKYYDSTIHRYKTPSLYKIAFGFGSLIRRVEIGGKPLIQDNNSRQTFWVPNDIPKDKWLKMIAYKGDHKPLLCRVYFPAYQLKPLIADNNHIPGAFWKEITDSSATKWELQTAPLY
ncbi:hypothetical protein P0136_05575 [Lentisphaerota bacterium ZTH]|nr:hypothetical protein JYG24_03310 [Lentisphaerota bacterium]WET07461.1 hypothetical protein P0136_05575 [Lentisphaerota bacterium ZTH]